MYINRVTAPSGSRNCARVLQTIPGTYQIVQGATGNCTRVHQSLWPEEAHRIEFLHWMPQVFDMLGTCAQEWVHCCLPTKRCQPAALLIEKASVPQQDGCSALVLIYCPRSCFCTHVNLPCCGKKYRSPPACLLATSSLIAVSCSQGHEWHYTLYRIVMWADRK